MSEETTFTPIGLSADLVLLNAMKRSSLKKDSTTKLNKDVVVSSNDNKQADEQFSGEQLRMFG